jgi:hypothetical protein
MTLAQRQKKDRRPSSASVLHLSFRGRCLHSIGPAKNLLAAGVLSDDSK